MRKGLVVTLGVALVLSAVPAFAEAPLLSCMPDIVISDYDQSAQTADTNQWIFTNALDLDEFVTDADTSDVEVLWSFIDPDGKILINGKDSLAAPVDAKTPAAANQIREGDGVIDIANTSGVLGASMVSMVTFYASDGDKVSSETVQITSVNTDGSTGSAVDHVVSPELKNWQFASNQESFWTETYTGIAGFTPTTLQWLGGSLEVTEPANHGATIVYGGWKSPVIPSAGIAPKVGCIMRARYMLRSSVTPAGAATPGFRLQAVTQHSVGSGSTWAPDWASLDFIDQQSVQYSSFNIAPFLPLIADRMPDATASEYVFLYYPNQVAEMLLSSSTVTRFTFDLLDTEGGALGTDNGTLYLDSLVVDGVDRPEPGTSGAQTVTTLTTTNFVATDWNVVTNLLALSGLPTPNVTGLVSTVDTGDLSITVAPGNQSFETYMQQKPAMGARLTAGNYIRVRWELTATVGSTTNAEPRVRLAAVSTDEIWAVLKEQAGGAAIAGLTQEPQMWEQWFVAPPADPRAGAPAGMTEPIVLRFSSWQTTQAEFPVTAPVAGTIKALSVLTESFAPLP